MRIATTLVLLAAAAGAAIAKPTLSSKEFGDLKKAAQKAAARGEHSELRDAIDGLARDDSSRAAELIASIAAHVPEVYPSGVRAVAGMESEDAWKEVLDTLKKSGGAMELKVFFVDVCAAKGDDRAAEGLMLGLSGWKKSPSVVRAAVDGIKKKKVVKAVDGLIDLLAELESAKEDGNLLYTQVREALLAITGEQFEKAVDYRNYWEPRKAQFRPVTGPAKKLEGGTSERKRPTFFGSELRSNRLVFVIDVSGSMEASDPPSGAPPPTSGSGPQTGGGNGRGGSGSGAGGGGGLGGPAGAGAGGAGAPGSRVRIERAKAQLIETLGMLPPDAKFAVFAYSGIMMQGPSGVGLPPGAPDDPKQKLPPKLGGFDWLQVWKEPRLHPANEANKKDAQAWVEQLKANGATFTFNALREAFDVEGADTIVLLSDGVPTEFDREQKTQMTTDRILQEVEELNRFKRLRIDTFGFDPEGGGGDPAGQGGGGSRRRGGFGGGMGALSEFLQKLAESNGGGYQRID